MKRECTEFENRILKECAGDILALPETYAAVYRSNLRFCKKTLPGNKFRINGGTIINMDYSKEGTYLIYAEDDLMDSKGNHAVCIPHPAAIDLDQRSSMMYEYEKEKFMEKFKSFKTIRLKNWIAIVLLSFLILFLFALLFIGLVTEDVNTEFSTAVIFAAVQMLVWMFLIYKFAKFVLSGRTRGLDKVRYKKKVMFHSVNGAFDENNIYTKYISVCEYINGIVELVSYPVNSNVILPKKMPYGKMIYKYSRDEKSCAKDLNFFGVME